MNLDRVSEYNREQWTGFKAIEKACRNLSDLELKELGENLKSYLQFREALAAYQQKYFGTFCQTACFESRISACCGFESIFTFFADQLITYLLSTPEQMEAIFRKLEQPNQSSNCVFLGETGCIWSLPPISCAMFLCEQAKRSVFDQDRHAEAIWDEFRRLEKEYTHPTKPVLFDDVESYFILLGVDSPHMYFHQSPGLLRLKSRSGL
jgi:hypothetical protein